MSLDLISTEGAIFCDHVFQEEVEDADDLQSFDEYIETLPEFSQCLL